MRKVVITAGLTCALALPVIAGAQSSPPSNPPSTSHPTAAQPKTGKESSQAGSTAANGTIAATDKTFVMEAAKGGMAEVELGRLATEKAANADVKQFGQRMVDDHSKANEQLKSLAAQKGVTLPTA